MLKPNGMLHSTLPLPLQPFKKGSLWHPFGVSSISSLQPEEVLIWWKCIWLQCNVSSNLIFLFLPKSASHESCFIFLYATICSMLDLVDSIWKFTTDFPSGLDNIPTSFLMIDWYLWSWHPYISSIFVHSIIVGRFFIDKSHTINIHTRDDLVLFFLCDSLLEHHIFPHLG